MTKNLPTGEEAVTEFIERLMNLEPEIGSDEVSEEAKLYCRLNTVYCDMFLPAPMLTESNLVTLDSLPSKP